MSRTQRRTLAFESLEGKVLLSRGMIPGAKAVPAIVHRARATPFLLDGSVAGLPYGAIHDRGIQVSSFNVVGRAKAMGRVNGSFHLANSLIPQGKMPDLSDATLTLSNSKGSVQLTMASSPSTR